MTNQMLGKYQEKEKQENNLIYQGEIKDRLGFITYLWIDNIATKNKNLKSYGNPLSWF